MNQRNDTTPEEPQIDQADDELDEQSAQDEQTDVQPSEHAPDTDDLEPATEDQADDVVADEADSQADAVDEQNAGTDEAPEGEDDEPATPAGEAELEDIAASIEALLFSSDAPLAPAKIAAAAEVPPRMIKKAVALLNERYETMRTAFRIETIAGGYQMLTRPEYHDVLTRMLAAKKDSRLSQAALETLAIVAYRQPILRADIEVIRGVACGEVLRSLMDRSLVKIVGRAEVIGRPMLYGTTKQFLQIFGLGSLDDLPRVDELRGKAEPPTPAKPKSEDGNEESEDSTTVAGDDDAEEMSEQADARDADEEILDDEREDDDLEDEEDEDFDEESDDEDDDEDDEDDDH